MGPSSSSSEDFDLNNGGRCFFVIELHKHLLKYGKIIFVCNHIASTLSTSFNVSIYKDIEKWGNKTLYYWHMNGREEMKTHWQMDSKASRTTVSLGFVQGSINSCNKRGFFLHAPHQQPQNGSRCLVSLTPHQSSKNLKL